MKKVIKNIILILALAAGFTLQVFVYWQIYPGNSQSAAFSPGILMALYFTGVVLLMAGSLLFYNAERPQLSAVYLLLFFFVPFYGTLGALVTALYNINRKNPDYTITPEDEELLLPLDEIHFSQDSWEMIRGRKWIQSYFDIMSGTNKNLKKQLLTKIMDENVFYGVALLKIALLDKEYEIRSFAATVLNKLEEDANKEILKVKRKINRDPGDFTARIGLGQMYFAICFNGLADTSTKDYYLNIAGSILTELKQDLGEDSPHMLDILLLEGRIARFAGDADKEREIYNLILAKQPDHMETISHTCALDFKSRDFKGLTGKCRQWLAANSAPGASPLGESLKTWIGK